MLALDIYEKDEVKPSTIVSLDVYINDESPNLDMVVFFVRL